MVKIKLHTDFCCTAITQTGKTNINQIDPNLPAAWFWQKIENKYFSAAGINSKFGAIKRLTFLRWNQFWTLLLYAWKFKLFSFKSWKTSKLIWIYSYNVFAIAELFIEIAVKSIMYICFKPVTFSVPIKCVVMKLSKVTANF